VPWRENPAIPLGNIARYINMPDSDDPMIQFERAVKHREDLTAKIRAKLADDPDQLAAFDKLFDAAQYAYPLTEDHAFYIDQMGVVLLRTFVLAVGDALVAVEDRHRQEDRPELPRREEDGRRVRPMGTMVGKAGVNKIGVAPNAKWIAGGAKNWLDKHYSLDWKGLSREQKEETGFKYTKSLKVTAETCLACHVGNDRCESGHDLLAAGHPRLNFDFSLAMAHYPKHWSDQEDHERYPDYAVSN
jgi:hypothetical protein